MKCGSHLKILKPEAQGVYVTHPQRHRVGSKSSIEPGLAPHTTESHQSGENSRQGHVNVNNGRER